MGEFRVQGHDVRLVDGAGRVNEGDIAVGHGAVGITVVAHLVRGQRHAGLFHLHIADGKHAAVILIHRNRVGFKDDVLFVRYRGRGAEQGHGGHAHRDQKSLKTHKSLDPEHPNRASLFCHSSPCQPSFVRCKRRRDGVGADPVRVTRHGDVGKGEILPGGLLQAFAIVVIRDHPADGVRKTVN